MAATSSAEKALGCCGALLDPGLELLFGHGLAQ